MPQINLRVDDETDHRLQYLSERTGRSKTFYATEALTQYLDENEDYLLAKDALEEFTQSNDDAIDLADVVWPV
ncbi:TraY domain-containing protein [Cryobacterium sp. TMS1-20-1]|uniref:Relaxosome protein TraY n=1 Tax=Cryobacterium levicorallinum TaxID=995038 RepID=A0A1I2ZHK7_9MICO|nr:MULTISPECIES: TraY domain-containing protein [Cryobacterium]TFB89479.1 TraY domain-containing protein [Cryobacterium levicorallinum]TFC80310.1 TraY domain-containing protein [Cryobacterium sp. TMS1-20-1]TFD09365.1 TraY domain-containing protein [Cryobacterium sp. TMT1-66-1]TFD11909.1 TraY domain-containing protein [Cryobacterium sp. TMT1-2-2]TFD52999.1 TraY domain-containing protein [Cryobacterium sp. Hh11]